MKAIVYKGPKSISVEEKPIPIPDEDEVLIKVEYAGICGSDMTIYNGNHPRAKTSLIFGHEFSGRIASHHPRYSEGTLVSIYPYRSCNHCDACNRGLTYSCETLKLIGIDVDGGMAEYVVVGKEDVFEVEKGISPKLAAFVEPISIGVHAVHRANYLVGSTVVLFGAGSIGLSTALTLRHSGADKLLVCEPNKERCEFAKSLGIETLHIDGENTLEKIYEKIGNKGADFVFDCAGHQSVISLLPDVVRIGGTICIVAGYKQPPVMDFQKGMFKEFKIIFTRNSSRQDFLIATRLAALDKNYEKIINCILPIEKAQEGFDSPAGAYKVMFDLNL